jgi:hypothetical protein
MTNFTVSEGQSVREELETNPDIKVGDTIEYITNNQQGYQKYKVILGDEGEKSLKLIDSYDHQMGLYDYDSDNDNDTDSEDSQDDAEKSGGKKRRTHKRRKSHKKNKTHKRKTHKRKTHKRKTHKRKTHKRKHYKH